MTGVQTCALPISQLGQSAGNLANTNQSNLINATTVGGNLAGQQQTLGLGDVNALATYGGQQQQIAQNQQLFPLQTLNTEAGLMRGYTIPTSTNQTFTGSPLSAIASLGSTAAALSQPTYTIGPDGKMVAGPSAGSGIYSGLSDIVKSGYDTVKNAFTPQANADLTTPTGGSNMGGSLNWDTPVPTDVANYGPSQDSVPQNTFS